MSKCTIHLLSIGGKVYQGLDDLDFHIGNGQEEVDCPQQLCIQSNTFCIQDEIGDGVCQSYNNVEFCNYDAGDCCLNDNTEA